MATTNSTVLTAKEIAKWAASRTGQGLDGLLRARHSLATSVPGPSMVSRSRFELALTYPTPDGRDIAPARVQHQYFRRVPSRSARHVSKSMTWTLANELTWSRRVGRS